MSAQQLNCHLKRRKHHLLAKPSPATQAQFRLVLDYFRDPTVYQNHKDKIAAYNFQRLERRQAILAEFLELALHHGNIPLLTHLLGLYSENDQQIKAMTTHLLRRFLKVYYADTLTKDDKQALVRYLLQNKADIDAPFDQQLPGTIRDYLNGRIKLIFRRPQAPSGSYAASKQIVRDLMSGSSSGPGSPRGSHRAMGGGAGQS